MDKVLLNVNELIQKYSKEVSESIEKRIDETADEILGYIKKNAPRSGNNSNHLADSFVKTKVGDVVYISSKTKGSLVHLIELGFKHKGGRFIKGRPFLIPSFETFTPKMMVDLKRIIENGTA